MLEYISILFFLNFLQFSNKYFLRTKTKVVFICIQMKLLFDMLRHCSVSFQLKWYI